MLPAYLQHAANLHNLEKLRQIKAAARNWCADIRHITPHTKQELFLDSRAKFKVIRAGRRGGKTVGIAELAVRYFEAGGRVLYATPTQEQVDTFWFQVKWSLEEPLENGALYKNETEHVIEVASSKNRIRAKTAWDADTLRGDYGDLLIFDEYQLMNEDAWGRVGAPMLLDNDGDAVFIYTPPSLHSKFRSKAYNPRHAAELFKAAAADESGDWETFHFTSHDNPHLRPQALERITRLMSSLAYEQEILAEDKDEAAGALWKRDIIERTRRSRLPTLVRVVVGVDPTGSSTNECGIVVGALGDDGHGYVLDDASLLGSPKEWASAVVAAYNRHAADRVLGEKNYGGDMVEFTIRSVDGGEDVSYKNVNATRGKAVRAEPVSALYERNLIHHVGTFPGLEDEMVSWVPGQSPKSPNRCFPAGTMIATIHGDKPIESVQAGELVLTRRGYRRVVASGMTSKDSSLLQLTLSYGIILECTPDHPIFVSGRGFVPAWTIKKGEQVAVLASRLSASTVSSTGAIPTAQAKQQRDIFFRLWMAIERRANHLFIARFGNFITDLFRRVIIFTTGIKTLMTMTFPIWNLSLQSSTVSDMHPTILNGNDRLWITPANSLRSGTEVRWVLNGIESTAKKPGLTAHVKLNWFVQSVARNLRATSERVVSCAFALGSVSTTIMTERSDMLFDEPALFVEHASPLTDLDAKNRCVPANVLGLSAAPNKPVHNLTIENQHEYFANGILVHNCDAMVWVFHELMLEDERIEQDSAPDILWNWRRS